MTADEFKETPTNSVDGNSIGKVMLQSGSVAKVIGKLEGRTKQDCNSNSQDISPDFLRSAHNGTGTLHKSISTPSVPHM